MPPQLPVLSGTIAGSRARNGRGPAEMARIV